MMGYYRVRKDEYNGIVAGVAELTSLVKGLKAERDQLNERVKFLETQNLELIKAMGAVPMVSVADIIKNPTDQ